MQCFKLLRRKSKSVLLTILIVKLKNSSITVIIVNYNTCFLLHESLGALCIASRGLDVNIIVVDNASKDGSAEIIRRDFANCQLIENTVNVGFGRANNQALPFAKGEFVLLLNTDAFVQPDALAKSVAYMQTHPECGILGARLTGRDGQLQPSARFFPTPWSAFLQRTGLHPFFKGVQMVDDNDWGYVTPRHCDWVPGCYYLIRKAVIDQVGLFDPRYFLYFEEVDHCFAVKRAGWDVVCFPGTTVVHIGGESAKSDGAITKSGRQLEALQIESELLYFRKNHGVASIMTDVLLNTIAAFIVALKRLVGLNTPATYVDLWGRTTLFWRLLVRTRLGSCPTR